MKYIIGALAFLLFLGVGRQASASSKIYGVNFGNQLRPKTYIKSQVDADLNELKADGVTNIRLATVCYDNCGGGFVDMMKSVALQGKTHGFSVMFGIDTSASPIDINIWNNFLASGDGYAKWCVDNGIDIFNFGNEEDNRVDGTTITKTYLHDTYLSKIQTLKTTYPSLKFTYAASQDNISNWSDTGALDNIGFNLYGGSDAEFRQGITQAQANPKTIVTEWNLDQGIYTVNRSQSRYASSLVQRRNWLLATGLTRNYIFTLRGGGQNLDNRWSLWVGTRRLKAWSSLMQ